MEKQQFEDAFKGAWGWTKKTARIAHEMANEQVDNHRIRSIKKRLASLTDSCINLKKETIPKFPEMNEITTTNAKKILHMLKNDASICSAEIKGNQLNSYLSKCHSLLESNEEKIDILPENKQPSMPEKHLVTIKTVKEIEQAIKLGATLISIKNEGEAIKGKTLLDANLQGFFKAYDIDGYKLACTQYQTPNLVLGTAASLSSQRAGSGAMVAVNIIGSMVDGYHKGGISGDMKNMRLYLENATIEDKYKLLILIALKLQGVIGEQEYVSLYYGYYFDEGRTHLTPENEFQKHLEIIKKNKKPSKARAISLTCSAYLLEKYAISNRAKVIDYILLHESKIDPLIIELINETIGRETASTKIVKLMETDQASIASTLNE